MLVWLPTRKVKNRPNLLSCRQRATYHWKALYEGYNFALYRTSIRGLLAKLWGSKVAGVGVSREKNHLDVGFVERCKVYYKGEGGGFPQVWAVVSLVCPCCPWLVLAPKVLQLCTNHLVWVVCRPMWVSEACQFFLVPSWSCNTPLYPSKCCELGSVPRLFPLPLFCTSTHFWILQGVGSASSSFTTTSEFIQNPVKSLSVPFGVVCAKSKFNDVNGACVGDKDFMFKHKLNQVLEQ